MTDTLERLKRLVGRATCRIADTPRAGTAFLVTPSHALTCAHVVGDDGLWANSINLHFSRGFGDVTARVLGTPDPTLDIAVLELERELDVGDALLPLLEAPPRAGEAWHTFCHPAPVAGDGLMLSGQVDDPNAHSYGERVLQLSTSAARDSLGGASGAPVLVHGAIAGMLIQQLRWKGRKGEPVPVYEVTYAVGTNALRAHLQVAGIVLPKTSLTKAGLELEVARAAAESELSPWPHGMDVRWDAAVQLTKALLACQSAWKTRSQIYYRLFGSQNISLEGSDLMQAGSLVEGCLRRRSLFELLTWVLFYEGKTQAWENLEKLAVESGHLFLHYGHLLSADETRQIVDLVRNTGLDLEELLALGQRSAPTIQVNTRACTIALMIADLGRHGRQPDGSLLLMTFVSLVAKRIGTDRSKGLRQWLDTVSARHGFILPQSPAETRERILGETAKSGVRLKCGALLVSIYPLEFGDDPIADTEMRYTVEGWCMALSGEDARRLHPPPRPKGGFRLDEDLPDVVGELINQALVHIDDQGLLVELIVPVMLMHHDFGRWIARIEKLGVLIGRRYGIIIRSYERIYFWRWQQARSCWKRRSERLLSQSDLILREATFFAPSELIDDFEELFQELLTLDDAAPPNKDSLAIASTVPSQDALHAVLEAGMPVALWPRHCGDPEHVESEIQTLLGCPVESFPMVVRDYRKQNYKRPLDHLAHHLIVFWDDARRRPPEDAFEPQVRE